MTNMLRMVKRHMPKTYTYALKNGWTLEVRPGGHIAWRKDGRQFVISAVTPSDRRGDMNAFSRLRREDRRAEA